MSTNNYSEELLASFQVQFRDRVKFNEPVAPYVAYRVGGPADILVFPKVEADLEFVAKVANANSVPITIIGTGTNLLVKDKGIRGITVSLKEAFKEIAWSPNSNPDRLVVRAGGGVEKPLLLEWAIENSLTGLEFSSGVPGTIGGGIFMNAGTKYGCYGDILREIRLFDFVTGARQIKTSVTQFEYRKQHLVKDTLVLWTDFELKRGDKSAIRMEVNRIIAERASKQPLDFPSCGSTFKNPPEGMSAGRLIEKSNLKGTRIGGAEISEKHANFILNKGGASASDILGLIDIVKQKVKEQFQVELECEVIILGE